MAFSAEFTDGGKRYRMEADGNGEYSIDEIDLPDTVVPKVTESSGIKADDISVSDC